jgi:uncharacterized protein YecE (DUF72 family)
MSGSVYVGLSGWAYDHWRDGFYKGIPSSQWLRYCAERFDALEINASFYRLQKAQTLKKWSAQSPGDFVFSLKAHRYNTHVKRLRDPEQGVVTERDNARPLGSKLKVVLWQLPGNFRIDLARLDAFCKALGRWRSVRHSIEFRHRSWFNDEVAALLRQHRVAVCQSDAADWPLWNAVTTDLVYVRLHGHSHTYVSRYQKGSLQGWAQKIRRWQREGRQVHVYFDNDGKGAAPYDALRLISLLR